MGNIMDYIKWRGDLDFSTSPFNEVDNLILSLLAYVNLDGISVAAGQKGAGIRNIVDEISETSLRRRTEKRQIIYPLCAFYDDGYGRIRTVRELRDP